MCSLRRLFDSRTHLPSAFFDPDMCAYLCHRSYIIIVCHALPPSHFPQDDAIFTRKYPTNPTVLLVPLSEVPHWPHSHSCSCSIGDPNPLLVQVALVLLPFW